MKKKYTDPWKDFAERYDEFYAAPGKPTNDEKKIFYKLIKNTNIKKGKALVLGATPALRDILAKFNLEVTIVDINKKMIKAMNRLIAHKKKEKIVESNWLKMPFPDNHFDIILGDLTISNLDAKNQPRFFKEVKRILKPTGYWIHRIFLMPLGWKFESTETVLKRFSKIKHPYDRNTELFAYLAYNIYNKKTHEIDTSKVKKVLDKYWKKNRYVYPKSPKVEELMNRAYQMWKPFKKVWYLGTKKEIFSRLSKFFKIIKEDYAKDHYFGKSFIVIVCRPK
ncbi:class I SAM-dependent methyltransferase [Candidatus Woesearchaeota archaeon]|nr:class I SAM-dependent methyltransferase [Candidatus Woesearchaeota archaeon]